jgi:two-component system response regulator RegA
VIGMLVDDDELFLKTLQRSLQKRGLQSVLATSVDEARTQSTRQPLDFALIDLRIGAGSGLELIEPLRHAHPGARILLITGYASIATAVEAIKRGADDYLLKPTTADAIVRAVHGDRVADPDPQSVMTPIGRLEWEHIHQALTQTGGNISAAARLLGMHRRSLQRKLAKRPSPDSAPGSDA